MHYFVSFHRTLLHILFIKPINDKLESNTKSNKSTFQIIKEYSIMSLPTNIIQENDQELFLVEQVALCLPCGSGLSLAGTSCDASSLASWEMEGDIDSSFSSRSFISPMARALDIQDRLPLQLPVVQQSKKKGKKGRKQRKQRPQLTTEQMAKLPCRFFQSKAGCRAGACCPYNHATL